jgi:soluble lytic murein transglycosylase-like protein
MNSIYLSYIIYYASLFGVNPTLVQAIVQVESHGSPSLVGEAGEVGLFQLLPSSFPNVKKLRESRTNIEMGIKYLAKMKRECIHQQDNTWVVCYNAGLKGGSRIKHPKLFPYYVSVMREYKRLRDVESLSVQTGIGVSQGSR